MPTQRFVRLLLIAIASLVLGAAAAAYAEDNDPSPPPQCQEMNANGDLPECTYDGTRWSVDYPSAGGSHFSNSGVVLLVAVLAAAGGIAVTVWRVTMARRIAAGAGLDPDVAATATLFGEGGLTATYLAANLGRRTAATESAARVAPAIRTPEQRLADLSRLHDEGVVTDEEYAARRKAIVDSL